MEYYLIKHTKEDEIKFSGHLDLTTAIQRIISRAGLKINYSQGFNPHMILSSAQPVPVGMLSNCEYLMGEFDLNLSNEEILEKLNEQAPDGIKFTFIKKLETGKITPMGTLTHINYEIVIPGDEEFKKEIEELLQRETWLVETRNKKGHLREQDLKEKIRTINLEVKNINNEEFVVINMLAMAGSLGHLSLEHFLNYIKDNTKSYPINRFIKTTRLEMYLGEYPNIKPLEEM